MYEMKTKIDLICLLEIEVGDRGHEQFKKTSFEKC